MRCLINYRLRLGDVVACFPAAKILTDQGNEVSFSCNSEYHDIFKTISYTRPVLPSACDDWKKHYDKFYDLEIHRFEYDRYRAGKIPWRHYIYGKYPELEPAKNALPFFDRIQSAAQYQLPEEFTLACPFGVSQVTRINHDWFFETCRSVARGPTYVLAPPGKSIPQSWGQPLAAKSLADLPGIIQAATVVVTINSAPNIIAAGVRKSYYHVREPGFDGQDDYKTDGQIELIQPASLNRASWRHVVNQLRYRLLHPFS